MANKDIAQFVVKESTRVGQPPKCCCRFDSPWPVNIKSEIIGRKPGEGLVYVKTLHCLPVRINLTLSKRTLDAYEKVCHYLKRKTPMTMLELKDFSAAASYLNYVRPKSPNIMLTLRIKPLSRMTLEVDRQLEEEIPRLFLSSHKPFAELDGSKLDTYDLRMLREARGKLGAALKSEFVSRSYDEYVISFAALDILAAYEHIKSLAVNKLGASESLLRGEFNQYEPSTKPAYFAVDNLDCRLARETKRKLSEYFVELKRTLAGLFEKLTFEHMSERYEPLIALNRAQLVFQNLIEVNCGSPARQPAIRGGRH